MPSGVLRVGFADAEVEVEIEEVLTGEVWVEGALAGLAKVRISPEGVLIVAGPVLAGREMVGVRVWVSPEGALIVAAAERERGLVGDAKLRTSPSGDLMVTAALLAGGRAKVS